jgi:hypothetical protein
LEEGLFLGGEGQVLEVAQVFHPGFVAPFFAVGAAFLVVHAVGIEVKAVAGLEFEGGFGGGFP